MSNQMMQAMQQIQLMQQKMAEAQAALADKSVVETGGDGMVEVTVNGLGVVTKIVIAPQLLEASDKEMLEDLLITTINRAIESAKKMANDEIGEATRGLMPNIPGFDLPF
jgi:DNA-binding YbaB/EbfC family protein